jgi:NADH-quinone oxidoreductase subunit E
VTTAKDKDSGTFAIPMEPVLKILDDLAPVSEGSVIPLLQKLQDAYGYLPKEAVLESARRTGLPASRMFGVATFYAQFRLRPSGRHTIRVCRGTACHVRGSKEVADAIMRRLKVEEGGTTDDRRFTFETVACLGTCFLAPVIMVDNDYYGSMSVDRIEEMLARYE